MSNEVQISGRFTVATGDAQASLTPSDNLSFSSSFSYYNVSDQWLQTGSWVALNTGSATNKQYLVINNISPSGSSIFVSTTPNSSSMFTPIPVGGFSMFHASASINYYVFATAGISGSGLGLIQIGVTE